MKLRLRTVLKLLGAAALLWIAVGLGAPYVDANAYTERLRGSLSRALGRQVEFRQPVRFSLFQGPGFSAEDVVIHEDPAVGAEPMAYMDSMSVRPSIWSLLGGRFVVASIRLEGAHLNLTKSAGGNWNFLSFMNRSVMSATPAIHVRDGRINFKSADTKSVFYLMETDLDISPPGPGGAGWSISCSGKPARTDRPAQGLGSFTLKGRWFVAPDRVDLDLRLDRSGLGEITALLEGQAGSVHGTVSSRLHLGGPIDNIGIQGRLLIEDVHRWDLMPAQGQGWPLDLHGRLNLVGQEVDLESNSAGNAPLPLAIRFRAANYLSRPRWAIHANWNRFPVAPILELARHMGAQFPATLQLAGVMDGAVGYAEGNLQGQVAFQDASLTIPGSPPVRVERAGVVFDSGHIHLAPALVRISDQNQAQVEADYAMEDRTLDISISADAIQVASLRAQVALAAVPWLEQVRSGQWSGQLQYHYGPEQSQWTGQLDLRDAEVPVPGMADPLHVTSAHAQLDGAHVALDHIAAEAGKSAFTGSYSYEPGAARPHRLRLHAALLDAADVEAEWMPTLRRNPGILARALGRSSLPDWLRERAVDGAIQVDAFVLAGARLENVRAHLLWDAARVQFDGVQAKLDRATLTGALTVNLRGTRPAYKLTAKVKGLPWQAGKLDAAGTLEASGTGLQLVTSLKSDGTFTAAGLDFGGLTARTASGNYTLAWAQTAPRLRLNGIGLRSDDDTYTGHGGTLDDGRLQIVLTDGVKEVRVSGPWDKLKLEEAKP
jgi:uncharacterized protein involved in outer membrane biogenesis